MPADPEPKPTAKSPADTQPVKLPVDMKQVGNGRSTGKFSSEEIMARLEAGRMEVQKTEEGSTLKIVHAHAPPEERRNPLRAAVVPPPGMDRRRFVPLQVPTLFPESGPILILLIGGFADDRAMEQERPFWKDDQDGGALVWQALARSGLVHRKDQGFAMGQGGFWEDAPPRTQGLAMTYAGFRRRGEVADFEQVIKP